MLRMRFSRCFFMKKINGCLCYLVLLCCASFSQLHSVDSKPKLNRTIFLKKIREYQSSDSWAYKAISSEIDQFSSFELSPNYMHEIFYNELRDPSHLICIGRIKNNAPQVAPNGGRKLTEREEVILSAMRSLCKMVRVPDVMFLFSSHDSYDGGSFPVVTFSKMKGWKSMLMPDFEAMEGYGGIRSRIHEANHLHSWSSKIDKLFWRGATTGGTFTLDNYAYFPRSLAVIYSLDRPDLMDAKFTNVVQDTPGVSEVLHNNNMMGDFVSMANSLQYKYLLDIDGNANTYSRCFWILLSNSVLFKMDSDYIQWYYSLLQEGYNYIRLLPDLSDLEWKLQLIRQNDRMAEQIAINGSYMAEEDLSHEAVLAYFFCFLKTLAARQ